MRRVITIAVAAASLGGCSSFSLDSFKPTPPSIQVQLESTPPGADAKTSLGPSCKTPCSVSVPAPDAGFSVDLHPEQVPTGNYSSPDYPQSRRFLDDHRSQSGIRGTAASRSAAEGFRQTHAQAKEAEAAWRCGVR
jgi:hypothetical protein